MSHILYLSFTQNNHIEISHNVNLEQWLQKNWNIILIIMLWIHVIILQDTVYINMLHNGAVSVSRSILSRYQVLRSSQNDCETFHTPNGDITSATHEMFLGGKCNILMLSK